MSSDMNSVYGNVVICFEIDQLFMDFSAKAASDFDIWTKISDKISYYFDCCFTELLARKELA